MSFHQPSVWWLLLLLLVPVLWWRWARVARGRGLAFSSIDPVRDAGVSWAVRARWIVPVLRTLAIVVLIVAVARPRASNEHTKIFTEGIAIQLVVDRSGSMLAEDFELDRRRANRLAVVKAVVEEFIGGGDDLPGRPDDLLGLIAFATHADSICPLTLDHDHLIQTLRTTEVPRIEEDRATALGDAIALGVERLQGLERRTDLLGDAPIKSKVMIALTDGENNAGDVDPLVAAEMAAAFGIRVYTIGAGTIGGRTPIPMSIGGGQISLGQVTASIDEKTLRRIADMTGGEYFRATDQTSLESIYARIDELERTEVEQQRYTEYRELSLDGVRAGIFRMPSLLAIVFVLLSLEVLLASTRLRVLR